jgi:hypothetical protein
MAYLRLFAVCLAAIYVTACAFGGNGGLSPEETTAPSKIVDLGKDNPKEAETDPEKRVSDALQAAKSAYDDQNFEAAHKYAEIAENLVIEKEVKDRGYRATALNIQAYSLLQLGLIEDYRPQDLPGYVRGALTKFKNALAIEPNSFRAQLGLHMCQFRRHSVNIVKSEKLGEGVLCLSELEHVFKLALAEADKTKRIALFNQAWRLYGMLSTGRNKLLEIYEIFHDPMTMALDEKTGTRADAPRLGRQPAKPGDKAVEYSEEQEIQDVTDLKYVIQDGKDGKQLSKDDTVGAYAALNRIRSYWRDVRHYWRVKALQDLQDSRDGQLKLRQRDLDEKKGKEKMRYFWIDRDLGFTFTALGAFFLDIAFEDARNQVIAEGKPLEYLEVLARAKVISADFKSKSKDLAKENYEASLSYYVSFVQEHERFEIYMLNKAEKADFNDATENPFLVDLQSRYVSEMLESVREERGMRRAIILEECAMVVDPLYQICDLERALVFAAKLKSMDPKDPIHHFVRATAYYERAKAFLAKKENETAKSDFINAREEYDAYVRASSILDNALRKRARERHDDCDSALRRIELSKSAGGD